jgi:hypothetical protein
MGTAMNVLIGVSKVSVSLSYKNNLKNSQKQTKNAAKNRQVQYGSDDNNFVNFYGLSENNTWKVPNLGKTGARIIIQSLKRK